MITPLTLISNTSSCKFLFINGNGVEIFNFERPINLHFGSGYYIRGKDLRVANFSLQMQTRILFDKLECNSIIWSLTLIFTGIGGRTYVCIYNV